ncbi:MAG: NADH-quinone oxidoreductase subunit N [Balneolaceae bacterium]|nr:MAG: NADH-quinone oxidoreductase subunit N [Balneolaceae bacterium]
MVEQALFSLGYFLPEIILVVTLCVIIAADLFTTRRDVPGYLLLTGLVTAAAALVWQGVSNEAIFFNMIAVDPFALFFKILLLVTTGFVVLFSLQSAELKAYKSRSGEYYMLLTGMLLGMFLMVGSTHLLMMFLALELTSISSYVLAGFTKNNLKSSEASVKYIIYGAVSSGIMLYGITLLIGAAGTADIFLINEALQAGAGTPLLLNIAILMILVGFGFKIAVVPFHFWAPDVYEGAPVTITAYLSVASKMAAFVLLIRFFTLSFTDPGAGFGSGTWELLPGINWNLLGGGMAAMAMIVGNLTALRQDNIKRMLAYSSIAHAGYLLMGVVILTGQGLVSVLIYFVIYLFMNLGAFYVVMLFSDKFGVLSIENYKGLGHRAPFEGMAMTLFLVSLTGIPPTGGFVAKLYIFGAAISAGWIWLVVIAGVTTIISLFYYVRVVRNMFLFTPEESADKVIFGMGSKIILLLLIIPVLLLGIYFSPLIEWAATSLNMLGM